SIAFSAFAFPGIAQPCSSGGKGSRLPQASLWDRRKTDAPMGGEEVATGTPPGPDRDPTPLGRGGVPPGFAISAESGVATGKQFATSGAARRRRGRRVSSGTTWSAVQLSFVSCITTGPPGAYRGDGRNVGQVRRHIHDLQ